MKLTKRLTKFIFSILLIGFLFNVFHDFVFYEADPCLKDIRTFIKFDLGHTNDPLCKIHHTLHSPYTLPDEIKIKNLPKENKIKFSYKKPILKDIPREIFKPPISI
jgi:hypothetical protein